MDLSGNELLVVDDIKFTRTTLVRMLHGLGCKTVHEAADGQAALALLDQHPGRIDCVVTDLEMPLLDGLGLLQAIRVGTAGAARSLRVVLLTGHADLDRLGAALLLDLDAFLPKPASRQALERCLERLLGPRDASQPADADTYRAVDLAAAAAGSHAQALEAKPGGGERNVALAELPGDCVLARDLLFSNGRLLLPAGTHMTPRIVNRLHELAPLATIAESAWVRDRA